MSQVGDGIERVRRALGRVGPLKEAPVPPQIDEPITRLVHTDLGLAEMFARQAAANKMEVEKVYVDQLLSQLVAFLKDQKCRKVALPASSRLLDQLGIEAALKDAGFQVRRWDEVTLDELYSFDCGLTDVYAAVAETGSLVMKARPEHGRALSLVPPIHCVILEPKSFVPDLVDLFEKLAAEGAGSNTVIISGPSKTSDIEMTPVYGVHGPLMVKAFVLQ